jgi:hypothetical protein
LKNIKKVLLYCFVLAAIAGAIIFYIATKKPLTGSDNPAVIILKADEFNNELVKNHKQFDSLYSNKNIGISGLIKELSYDHVFINGGDEFSINCSFDSSNFQAVIKSYKVGDSINLKGIYSGSTGFDNQASTDGLDMIGNEKSAELKTCGLNR